MSVLSNNVKMEYSKHIEAVLNCYRMRLTAADIPESWFESTSRVELACIAKHFNVLPSSQEISKVEKFSKQHHLITIQVMRDYFYWTALGIDVIAIATKVLNIIPRTSLVTTQFTTMYRMMYHLGSIDEFLDELRKHVNDENFDFDALAFKFLRSRLKITASRRRCNLLNIWLYLNVQTQNEAENIKSLWSQNAEAFAFSEIAELYRLKPEMLSTFIANCSISQLEAMSLTKCQLFVLSLVKNSSSEKFEQWLELMQYYNAADAFKMMRLQKNVIIDESNTIKFA